MTAATQTVPTIDQIVATATETFQSVAAILDRLPSPLPADPDPGGWTVRQVLSHIVGAFQRIPVYAGYFLDSDPASVPIIPHDPYWIAEWETAPVESFRLALNAAFSGAVTVVESIDPAKLGSVNPTTFGDMTLAGLLMVSFSGHINDSHAPQLAAFAAD